MSSYQLVQLAAVCDTYPTQPKILFVPSPQIGYNLTTALAGAGHDWTNLEAITPLNLASRRAEAELNNRDLTRLEQDTALLSVEGILEELAQEDSGGYLSGLTISPGLSRSFLRTIQALRTADIGPGELEDRFDIPGKQKLLVAACDRFERWMQTEGYYDDAEVFRTVIGLLGAESDIGHVYAILDETPLTGLAFQFVTKLTCNKLYRIGRSDYQPEPPFNSAAARFDRIHFPETDGGTVGIGGGLVSDGLSPAATGSFGLFTALGAETEVRGVLREILERGLPLDTVEVAYTAESPYLNLLYDLTERFELQVLFAEGVPASLTRPGQALASFYSWIGSGCDSLALVDLCRSRLISFNAVLEPGETFEPCHLAAFLTRERVGTGGESSFKGLKRAEERLTRSIAELGDQSAPARLAREELALLPAATRALNALFALVPDNTTGIAGMVTASVHFLATFAPQRTTLDATARDSLTDRLNQIDATVAQMGSATQFAGRLGELLADHKIGASVAKAGHLYVVPLDRAGYTHRSHLYVLGMDESLFPGGGTEDPILLDGEREILSTELSLQRNRPAEKVWHLVRALGLSMGEVSLLANRRSLVDGRETYPTPIFHQAAEQLTAGKAESIPTLAPVPKAGQGTDDTETLLAQRAADGFGTAVLAAFGCLTDGQVARSERESTRLTRFDGWIGPEECRTGITDGTTVVSASRLEMLAHCPYKYFLRYVLHVEPPEDAVIDPARWLNPLEFGSLLHDLFFRFMCALHDRDERLDPERHRTLLAETLEELVAEYRERIPVRHHAAFMADRVRLDQAAEVFLVAESRRKGADPVGFEVSFGFGSSEGLNHSEPVRLRLGNGVELAVRGRIDRVDSVDGGYEIWDYKTGSARPYRSHDLLQGGAHLQWALYARVLESIAAGYEHEAKVRGSGYFFTSERENGHRMSGMPPTLESLGSLLAPLFSLAEGGWFVRATKGDPCVFCDYARICTTERRLDKKLEGIELAEKEHPEVAAQLRHWMGD